MLDLDLKEIINRIERLEKAVFGSSKVKKKIEEKKIELTTDIDFSLNERAFVKRYTADKSGPKKFVLLLAYLAQGEIGKYVELSEVKNRWGKMKSLLGNFNMFYPNQAKTNGWVDSQKYGSYTLTKEWENVLL